MRDVDSLYASEQILHGDPASSRRDSRNGICHASETNFTMAMSNLDELLLKVEGGRKRVDGDRVVQVPRQDKLGRGHRSQCDKQCARIPRPPDQALLP